MKHTIQTTTSFLFKQVLSFSIITIIFIGLFSSRAIPVQLHTSLQVQQVQAVAQSDDTIGADGVSEADLDAMNPLLFGGNEDLTVDEPSAHAEQLSKPAGIINRVISFAFPLAGIILFLMIVVGGFEMMIGAANKKSLDQGKQRVTNAIVGFIVLFSVYWIAQLVEMILGISMFGT